MLPRFEFTSRARPFVELGVSDTRIPTQVARWGQARWDDDLARWSGTEPSWLDISCDTISVDCDAGHERTLDRFRVGRAAILVDNTSGWADPNNTPDLAALSMRPGRAIRVGVDHAEYGRRILWRGFVDGIDPLYDPVQQDTVALSCIDALGEVNRVKLAASGIEVGAGEWASARVSRILDAASWPEAKRSINGSSATLVGVDLAGRVADLLGQTADSVGGVVFGDAEGRVCFRNRFWQSFQEDSDPDGIIGNVGAGDVCPTRWVRPFDRADLATRVLLRRVNDDPLTPTRLYDASGTGPVLYGIEPYERLDLLTEDDDEMDRLASRVLEVRSADTLPRIRSVSLSAATGDDVIDLLWGLDIYRPSRYLCRLAEARGLVFEDEYLATAVRHRIDAFRWDVDVNLGLAAPYAAAGGVWGAARWDRSTWAA